MVKSVTYVLVALILCIATFIGVDIYLKKQFKDFNEAVQVLYRKVEDKTATREDGFALRSMWADKKKNLHVFIPHNDVSYIDYWLSEACGLIYCEQYDLALGKIEVLQEITKNLPDGYSFKFENIF